MTQVKEKLFYDIVYNNVVDNSYPNPLIVIILIYHSTYDYSPLRIKSKS